MAYFYIVSELNPNLVLDIEGGSTQAGAKLITWTYHGGENQRFRLNDEGCIESVKSGLALDVEGGLNKGSKIIQWQWHGGKNQRFRLFRDGTIRIGGTDLCVDIAGANRNPGGRLCAWSHHGNANQRWRFATSLESGSPQQAEAEARAQEQQRLENERKINEQKAAELAAQRAELERLKREMEEARRRAEEEADEAAKEAAMAAAEAARVAAEAERARLKAEAEAAAREAAEAEEAARKEAEARQQLEMERLKAEDEARATRRAAEAAARAADAEVIRQKELEAEARAQAAAAQAAAAAARQEKLAVEAAAYNLADDAAKLNKAMKGIGTDEDAIIEVVCCRPRDYLKQLDTLYLQKYSKSLVDHIVSETGGHLETLLVRLFTSRISLMTQALRKAVKGFGTDDKTLVEILCLVDADDVRQISKLYSELYPGKSLYSDIKGDTSGDFRNMLLEIAEMKRADEGPVNELLAEADADAIIKASSGLGTNEEVIIDILSERSHAQIARTALVYANKTGFELSSQLKREASGNLRKCFKLLTLTSGQAYGSMIHECCAGAGTNEKELVEILTTISPEHLKAADEWYLQQHKKTIAQVLKEELNGDLKKAFVSLVQSTLKYAV